MFWHLMDVLSEKVCTQVKRGSGCICVSKSSVSTPFIYFAFCQHLNIDTLEIHTMWYAMAYDIPSFNRKSILNTANA